MPEVSYHYRVRVAGYEWTGNGGDPADYGPVDGLQIIRKLSDASELWPVRLDIAECRFQLIVASMDDVANIDVGSVVLVEITRPVGGSVTESFAGRVGELTATPHQLGMLLTLSCLDYKADLREFIVGDAPWPVESISNRLQRIMTIVGDPFVPFDSYMGHNVASSYTLIARDVDAQPALDLVEHYLDQYALDYLWFPGGSNNPDYRGLARGQLTQVTDANGELTGWHYVPMFQIPAYTGPLELQLVGGLWSAVAAPDPGVALALADEVDVGSTYAITKQDVVTRVTIAGGDPDGAGAYVVTVDTGRTPVVTARLDDSEIASALDVPEVAMMYLPGEVPVSRWIADSFLWHLELATAGAQLPEVGGVMCVGGIPNDQNPNDREWFVGQVSVATFTLEDQRPTYAFQLRRPDFDPPNTGVIQWDDAALVGKTWANVSTRDTWDDYRLVRGT